LQSIARSTPSKELRVFASPLTRKDCSIRLASASADRLQISGLRRVSLASALWRGGEFLGLGGEDRPGSGNAPELVFAPRFELQI